LPLDTALAEATRRKSMTDQPKRPIIIINDGVNRYVLASSAMPYMDHLEAQIASLREEVAQLKLLLELYETLEDIDGDEPDLSSSDRPTNPVDGESR
jgi:hypothetical protein